MKKTKRRSRIEGWEGWDAYAPFYDWENRRTIGRADIPFWQQLARKEADGPLLELGCGTGRVSIPLARAGAAVVGVDRSAGMLQRHARRAGRYRLRRRIRLVRADIRLLPLVRSFSLVIAPYGILQSLLSEVDLNRTLREVARIVRPNGLFAIDLASDLPLWQEYKDRLAHAGQQGPDVRLRLIETVRQDRRRGLTVFQERYIEQGRRRRETRFQIAFRTLSVPQMRRRLESTGFAVEAVLGDYAGAPWHTHSDVWVILARKR